METNESALSMQHQAIKWMEDQYYSVHQMATILQCSSIRAAKLRAGKSHMTMPEFGNVLHHAGFGWPKLIDLPVIQPQGAAPPGATTQPRSAPKRRVTISTPNSVFSEAVSEIRADLMERVPLPDVELDGHNTDEDMALGWLHMAYRGLVASVPAEQQPAAASTYAARVSLALAKAMVARFPGVQQMELDQYYAAYPDALVTPWDLVALMGGQHRQVDAVVLHNQALAQAAAV